MDLSRAGLIMQARATLDAYNVAVTSTAETVKTARQAIAGLKSIKTEWSTQTQAVHDPLDAVLRALQREGIDGDEYLKLRREHDKLAPLTEQLVAKESNLARVLDERAKLLA
jgi:hypothetical protein